MSIKFYEIKSGIKFYIPLTCRPSEPRYAVSFPILNRKGMMPSQPAEAEKGPPAHKAPSIIVSNVQSSHPLY